MKLINTWAIAAVWREALARRQLTTPISNLVHILHISGLGHHRLAGGAAIPERIPWAVTGRVLLSAPRLEGPVSPDMSSIPRLRPCDTCRHRKTRCVKPPDKDQCILCAFHGKKCTYLRGPPSRPRRQSGTSPAHAHTHLPTQTSFDRAAIVSAPLADNELITELPHSEGHDMSPASSGPDRPLEGASPEDFMSTAPALSLLEGTLGLDLDTHPEFIGPSSFLEPALLDIQRPRDASTTGQPSAPHRPPPGGQARRLDDRTMFLVHPDEATASEAQRVADCDAIEDCVRPLGKALVNLYFRIVHPSYPILHKGVYLAKHAVSHRMFSPPLLAAVYLIALDYQLYDPATTAGGGGGGAAPARPNGQAALEEIAERTMADDLRRPKLSTLQAGLLLLQRSRIGTGPSGWILTAQMVALAQGLGLHVDCSDWSIPEWEKGLRRRLGWALYMQDRWGALAWGRPTLLADDSWDLRPCAPADFPEAADEEQASEAEAAADGSVPADTGREAFIRQTELARLLSQVLSCFYTTAATKPGGALDAMGPAAAAQLAKPLILHLREWHAALPPDLGLEHIVFRRLSCAAPLQLAHAAVEVAI
ncbi:uncharacterized protein E0L32_009899 [Thyridium curvatum]|uniref:Zn(2)-C6 fungal-type domain-containing protein n=1 Tax=Thyridium curvatum TaxID=1093900 RepID=A0A507AWB9_9PEZI|nr:uncharacterized protein E0L32_009899 [Thyridium curvatum]TPX08560.1 hypothetical protein E0L32_009899 [Thyridium curvatum]